MKYAIQEPIPMNAEQKFFFDLRGWILLPGVLSDEEIGAMKAEAYSVNKAEQQQSINPRQSYRGTLQTLLDHPVIVGILSEILAEEPFLSDDFYAFRCENSFITVRPPGWSKQERGDGGMPHVVRPPQQANAMRYQAAGGKIFAGLTRVVWELEEVKAGQGGTSFLSGSHKAHFSYGGPDRFRPNISDSSWEDQHPRKDGGLQLPGRVGSHIHREPAPRSQRLDEPRQSPLCRFQLLQFAVGAVAPAQSRSRDHRGDAVQAPVAVSRRVANRRGEPRVFAGKSQFVNCGVWV